MSRDGKYNPVGDAWGKPLDGGLPGRNGRDGKGRCGCPPLALALAVLVMLPWLITWRRCRTRAEAEAGHARVVAALKADDTP